MSTLEERLAQRHVLILDGAVGTELQRRGVPIDGLAWSAKATLTHPHIVQQLHEDYIAAGADIITTNTFAAARPMLATAGLAEHAQALNEAAVALARQARDRSGGPDEVYVAGSISAMSPGEGWSDPPSLAESALAYREQAEVLAAAGVDLFILEMMRDVAYTRAAIVAALATGLPIWVGFSCTREDDRLMVRYPIGDWPVDLRAVIRPSMACGGSLLAIMHSEVSDTSSALELAREEWPGMLGAYPNSSQFTPWDKPYTDIISPDPLLEAAERWVAMGVQVVGGCCGIDPAHIRALKERLPERLPD